MTSCESQRWVETEAYARIAAARPQPLEELSKERFCDTTEIIGSQKIEHLPRQMLFEFTNRQPYPYVPAVVRVRLLDAAPHCFPDGPIEVSAIQRDLEGNESPTTKLQGYELGQQVGSPLTDNSFMNDGGRFHDAFHIAFATYEQWSPVLRSLLRLKRRSLPDVDENEDGARAIGLEESAFTMLGPLVQPPEWYLGQKYMKQVASCLERAIPSLTKNKRYIPEERWQTALQAGSLLLSQLYWATDIIPDSRIVAKTAYVAADLDRRELRTSFRAPEEAWRGDLITPEDPTDQYDFVRTYQ